MQFILHYWQLIDKYVDVVEKKLSIYRKIKRILEIIRNKDAREDYKKLAKKAIPRMVLIGVYSSLYTTMLSYF